ncbi:hypothetical protein ATANTOWER_019484, partial [Ataeniobius toweri]|nr:hypothetical protein [Ataeniobius toweri]
GYSDNKERFILRVNLLERPNLGMLAVAFKVYHLKTVFHSKIFEGLEELFESTRSIPN